MTMPTPNGTMTDSCAGTTGSGGNLFVRPSLLAPLAGAAFAVQPFGDLSFPMRCGGTLMSDGAISLPQEIDADDDVGSYYIDMDLEREELGMGKLIHRFELTLPRRGFACPKQDEAYSVACSMRLTGEVTMRRTGRSAGRRASGGGVQRGAARRASTTS